MTYDARHQAMREALLLEWAEGHGGIPETSRAAPVQGLQVDARDTPAAVVSGSTTAAGTNWRAIADMLAAQLGCHVYGGCPGGEATDHDDDATALRVYSAAVREAG